MSKPKFPVLPIVACLIAQICVGILYVWSVLKGSAISYFGWEEGAVNLVASYMLFAFCGGNFVGGALNDRIGPKKVCIAGMVLFAVGILTSSFLPSSSPIILFYASYCIVGGLGSGITYGAVISCVQKWFPHRRGFASGLATSAFGLATVVFSPLIGGMLETMSISATLRTLGIVFLVVGLGACIFIRLPGQEYLAALPVPAPKKTSVASDRSMSFGEAARTLPFWLMFLSIFFYNGTWNMLTPLIKGLGVSRGLSESAAVMAVSATGIANAAGRLLMASWSDKLGRINTAHLLSVMTIVCALLLVFVGGYAYFAVVLLTAFAFGGPSAVNPATSTDLFGPKYSGTNYGVIMMALGVSSICFNALSNALYAATGEYTLTFIMGAVTAFINIIIYITISRCLKKKQAAEAA